MSEERDLKLKRKTVRQIENWRLFISSELDVFSAKNITLLFWPGLTKYE